MSWRNIIILLVVFALASSALMLFKSPSKVENKEPTVEENTEVIDPSEEPSDEPTEEEFKNTGMTYDGEFTTIQSFDHLDLSTGDNLKFYTVLSDFDERVVSGTEKAYFLQEGASGTFDNNHFNIDLKHRTEEVYSLKFNMKFRGEMNDYRMYLKQPGYLDTVSNVDISNTYIETLTSKGMNFNTATYTELTFELILDFVKDLAHLNIYDIDGKNMLVSTDSILPYSSSSELNSLPVTLRIEFTNEKINEDFDWLEFGAGEYSKIKTT